MYVGGVVSFLTDISSFPLCLFSLLRYEEQYPAFGDSREAKLILALAKHVEDADAEAFAEEAAKFDQVSRCDAWVTSLLLRVKKTIPAEDELC